LILPSDIRPLLWMYGIECKKMDAPSLTSSMRIAVSDLGLKKLFVIYPGTKRYPLDKNIEAIPLDELFDLADLI
jgi:uncharacterized protein